MGYEDGIELYVYVKDQPTNARDPRGLAVEVCCRPTEVGGSVDSLLAMVGEHCWIRTATTEAGMGPPGGGQPEDAGIPVCNPTEITDHSGEGDRPVSHCHKVPGCNENCVNNGLQIGRPTGCWGPTNNCNTFVIDVLKSCKCRNRCLEWKWRYSVQAGCPAGVWSRECTKRDIPGLPIF